MGLTFSQLRRRSSQNTTQHHLVVTPPAQGGGSILTSSSEKVFTVLNDYLSFENPLPLDLAVESLLKLLPADAPDSEEIFRFGEDCFEIAEMLSYQSSSHSRLAQLLEALGLSSHFTSLTSENGRVWHFELLRRSMQNFCAGPEIDHVERYVNYNSFLAHLYDHRIFPTDPTYALWAMRAAFEDDRKHESRSLRSSWVLGAAQWILWNGQSLFKLVVEPALFDVTLETWPASNREAWEAGSLYVGTGGFSLERWRFWKTGFGQAADDDGLSEECRDISQRAMTLMEMFEKNMMF
ncbi:hypothetical protein PDE_09284 [Penicillium oxalicum 114-2]|uniref:Uncharacterized protein n=1 Tax=Penicillium oxalicum (strain 114-2 / CGMCC 5302) TaxID=933388 RepID=S7ZUE6_PENO1|nr:hypothetical protein PDE_09284 [Penicillium oxalicum 114-2]